VSGVRKISAIVLFASLPGVFQALRSAASTQFPQWATTLLALVFVVALIPILFLAALVLNARPLHFPQRFRKVALIGIICSGAYTVVSSFNIAAQMAKANAWTEMEFVANEIANLAQILLLFAFFRLADDEPPEPVSPFLSFTAKSAAIILGLWAAFNVVRLFAIPYTYALLRDQALRVGVQPFSVLHILGGLMPALLSSIGLFVPPHMVWRSLTASASRDHPPSPTIITPT
jgi:hypothetical protein